VITLVLEASTYAGKHGRHRRRARPRRALGRDARPEHEALMPAVAEVLAQVGVGTGSGRARRVRRRSGQLHEPADRRSDRKGIALAAVCPLVPISSLALVVASREPFAPGRYLAAIDALRGEHYVALFEVGEAGTIRPLGPEVRVPSSEVLERAAAHDAVAVGPGREGAAHVDPRAAAAARLFALIDATPAADLAAWEPTYGRLAEAQVKWEATHGRSLEAV
jgi:tRNA threonylcarbamoyladenosine biosynthesis protein TsaB